MATIDFKNIGSLKGVDKFIVSDSEGNIIAQKIEHAQKMAAMVSRCGQDFYAVGKTGFRHAIFKRLDGKHFLIFPMGKFYLGIMIQKDMEPSVLIKKIQRYANAPHPKI